MNVFYLQYASDLAKKGPSCWKRSLQATDKIDKEEAQMIVSSLDTG